jgi:hypothetical protein
MFFTDAGISDSVGINQTKRKILDLVTSKPEVIVIQIA